LQFLLPEHHHKNFKALLKNQWDYINVHCLRCCLLTLVVTATFHYFTYLSVCEVTPGLCQCWRSRQR